MDKNLIILGNGFDLHCSLKTNFSDFFIDSFRKNKSYDDMRVALNDKISKSFGMPFNVGIFLDTAPKLDNNFTVIDAMFIMIYYDHLTETRYWNNVEFDLQNSFTDSTSFSWHRVSRGIAVGINNNHDAISLSGTTNLELLMAEYLLEPRICNKFCNESKYSEKLLFDFIYSQLNIFEQRFANYVRSQINIGYIDKAQACISQICAESTDFLKTKIVSFNYTSFSGELNKYKIFNIHGSVNHDDCIIGVNSVGKNVLYKPFEKTRRKSLLNRYDDQTMDFDYENVKNVYIYGHSFNEMDFPAFFSIFTRLKLKDRAGDINFCIYYSTVNGENITDANKEKLLREKLFALLERYFNEFNNPLLLDMVTSSRIETRKI